ncbi:MAG: DUF4224 domain-containing protein [Burkholderiales bacterium]
MKSGLLTAEERFELTGYTRGADQMRFFKEQGLRPFPGRDGFPRITWEAINAAMSPPPSAATATAPAAAVLNWQSVRGRA